MQFLKLALIFFMTLGILSKVHLPEEFDMQSDTLTVASENLIADTNRAGLFHGNAMHFHTCGTAHSGCFSVLPESNAVESIFITSGLYVASREFNYSNPYPRLIKRPPIA